MILVLLASIMFFVMLAIMYKRCTQMQVKAVKIQRQRRLRQIRRQQNHF